MVSQGDPASVHKLYDPAVTSTKPHESGTLRWTVHLVRGNSGAVPVLALTILAAGVLVTMLFHSPIPGLIAVLLLIGSIREFLLPIHYAISEVGVESRSIGSHMVIAWKDTRRCLEEPHQITFTSLPRPSRLDVFRGVTVKYAPSGKTGDRKTVLAACSQYIPELVCDFEPGGANR